MVGTVSLYDVLKTRKVGLSPDLYTLLRARQEMPESVITAEPPIYFKSDGTAISEYQINGDTIQNGTPTPDNPVELLGVGDRTADLFDGALHEGFYDDTGELIIDKSGAYHSDLIKADEATYTISGMWISSPYFAVYEWDVNRQWLMRSNRQLPTGNPITFTLHNNCAYFSIQINSNYDYLNIMLNEGSTALPYEPYGYKIPIVVNGVTHNVYLDEPLHSGDYIKRNADGTGVLHQDGADTTITLPQLSVVKGNNELNISTTAAPEVTLKGKIKQLPDGDMNALLSVMEEM